MQERKRERERERKRPAMKTVSVRRWIRERVFEHSKISRRGESESARGVCARARRVDKRQDPMP